MFIEKVTVPRYTQHGQQYKQSLVWYRYECDECHKTYDKKPRNVSVSKSGLHFCSNSCKFASTKTGKLREASETTCLSRYGAKSAMQTEDGKRRMREGLQARHGAHVTSPLHVLGAKERRRRTHLERYGVEETFKAEGPKAKRRATWLKNYGVPYKPFDQNLIRQSMTKHPHKWSSKGETEMCRLLYEQYGEVIRQKWVNKWPIDAFVPAIDTYIQFDGVYWHGLDRPIQLIKQSMKPRDVAIYRKWLNDQEQNEWFASKKLRLVRITDIEFKRSGITTLTASSS